MGTYIHDRSPAASAPLQETASCFLALSSKQRRKKGFEALSQTVKRKGYLDGPEGYPTVRGSIENPFRNGNRTS